MKMRRGEMRRKEEDKTIGLKNEREKVEERECEKERQ